MMPHSKLCLLAALCCIPASTDSLTAQATKLSTQTTPSPLAIAGEAEDFTLRDIEGVNHRLSGYKGSRAIAICFNGVGCPISELYTKKLNELSKRYRDKNVQFLGINSNRQDEVRELRAFVAKFDIRFPVLKDHRNVVADRLGATRTTEIFLLDSDLKLRYRGSVDDQYSLTNRSVGLRKERAERNYLEDALVEILNGQKVTRTETDVPGCVIGRELRVSDATSLTYHRDVQPIIQERCQSCHREGQIAPFELKTYDDAAGWAGMIREVVENRRMPPWHANPKYGHFSNDRSLTESERDTILRWIDNGAPRGDVGDQPPAKVFSEDWQIGKPDVIFEMGETFEVPAEGEIKYQYFTVPSGFGEEKWVQAIEVQAGARDVVHHILVFCQDPRSPKRWRRRSRGGVMGYFGAMVPGQRPAIFPEGTAKKVPAGATFIFQVHYTTNGSAQRDRSRIGLVFAKSPVKNKVETRTAVQTNFRIPPNAEHHEVSGYHHITRDTSLLSFLPHMHLRGSSFRYVAHYPISVKMSKGPWSGRFDRDITQRLRYDNRSDMLTWLGDMTDKQYESLASCYDKATDIEALKALRKRTKSVVLLDIPSYDFGWQNTYRLARPILLPKGTVIEASGVFNNSSSNPALTKEMRSHRVRWGDQTWEEMMIGYFDAVYPESTTPPQ